MPREGLTERFRASSGGTATEWVGETTIADWQESESDRMHRRILGFRAGLVSERAISIGVSVRPPEGWIERWGSRGIVVHRRRTGGTGLLHLPGDLLWDAIVPRSELPRLGGILGAYRTLGAPLAEALRAVGVPATWAEPFDLSPRFCLFGPRGLVLAVGQQALGGAAQQLNSTHLLHHGIFGARVDRAAVADLFEVDPALLQDRYAGGLELTKGSSLEPIGRGMLERAARRSFD